MRIKNIGFKYIKLEFSNSQQLSTTLVNDYKNFQDVDIPPNVGKGVKSVKITAISVYSRYNYYGFDEIQVFSM